MRKLSDGAAAAADGRIQVQAFCPTLGKHVVSMHQEELGWFSLSRLATAKATCKYALATEVPAGHRRGQIPGSILHATAFPIYKAAIDDLEHLRQVDLVSAAWNYAI